MNELDTLNILLDELVASVSQLIESGEAVPDETFSQVASELEYLFSQILELEQVSITPKPDIEGAPYPSSNIYGFQYDPKTQDLLIKFQDKYPRTNGPVYQYKNIPQYIFDVFRRGAVAPKTSGKNAWHTWKKGVTPSLGASAYALIRSGGYPYQKVA